MWTIYKCHTELPLSKLGLDWWRVINLNSYLNTHSIQNAWHSIFKSHQIVSPVGDLTDVHVIKGGHVCFRLEVNIIEAN